MITGGDQQIDNLFAPPSTPPAATKHRQTLPNVRALDGVRGLAVIAVLCYHLDLPWAHGAFLSVPLFFTLSGFLITSLMLAGHEQHGRTDLKTFWARRFRRLIPAAWGGIAVAVLFAWIAGDQDQLRRLPGDVFGALGEVANWRFVLANDSYTATYQSPTPLLHYWTLAIEEQFYLIFPAMAAVLLTRRASARTWWIVLGGIGLGSFILTQVLYDPDNTGRVYFGTGTRLAEILAGVALAYGLRGWWERWEPHARRGARERAPETARGLAIKAAGLLPLVAVLILYNRVSINDQWVYRGGLFLVSIASVLMIYGALLDGPLSRLLGNPLFVSAGILSYGIYVYHWPLFLWLNPERTGLDGLALIVVRIVATIALALLSYKYLEKPIRTGQVKFGPPLRAAAVASVIVLGGSALYLSGQAVQRAVETAEAAAATPIVTQPPITSLSVAVPPPSIPKPPPRRILFLGDSLLHQAFPVFQSRFQTEGIETRAIGAPGQTLLSHQAEWLGELQQALAEWRPDVVVLESCCGHYEPKDPFLENGRPLAIDSPEQWAAFERVADQMVTMAEQHASLVLWALSPPAATNGFYGPIEARILRSNQIAIDLTETHRGLGLIDWRVIAGADGRFTPDLPDAAGNLVRVRAIDGLHFTPAGMAILADVTQSSLNQAWQTAATSRPMDVVPPAPSVTTTTAPP